MTIHAKTVWEAEGRAKKVAAICRAIDADLKGVREQIGAQLIVEYLRGQSDAWWASLCKIHGIRKPSAITVDCVIAEFDARAEQDSKAEPDDGPSDAELAEVASWR